MVKPFKINRVLLGVDELHSALIASPDRPFVRMVKARDAQNGPCPPRAAESTLA